MAQQNVNSALPPHESPDRMDRSGVLRGYIRAVALFSACLIYYLSCVGNRWNDRLLDLHSFRQTQTAISSYYMMRSRPTLAYETPVLGPPWSIPFEFPLYQWIVAAVASTNLVALDQAGRLVGIAFFLLTLIPAYSLLSSLRIPGPTRLALLAPVLVSPFYIYWSRSFLIESTGLFLAVCYTATVVRYLRAPRVTTALGSIVFGSLAALVKVTTFAPWFLAAATFVILELIRRDSPVGAKSGKSGFFRRLAALALMAGIPVLLLAGWTSFADRQKSRNTLGVHITSAGLKDWNFGKPGQKVSIETWRMILGRTPTAVGSNWVLLVAAIGPILARRRVGQFLACIVLFLSGPLLFTNLYYIHDYYSFANYLFLFAAIAVSFSALVEAGGFLRLAAVMGMLALVAINVQAYRKDPLIGPRHQNATELGRIADRVRSLTSPDEVIVLLGFDWSPVIPYYSERRALMLPPWVDLGLTAAEAEQAVADLKGRKIGALLFSSPDPIGPISADRLKELLKGLGFDGRLHPTEAPFQLYLPTRTANRDRATPLMARP